VTVAIAKAPRGAAPAPRRALGSVPGLQWCALIALIGMIVVEMINLSQVLGGRSPVPVFAASLALGLVAVAVALCDAQARARLNGWTLVFGALTACYLGAALLASVGSQDGAASSEWMRRSALDCLFMLVVFLLAQMTRRPWIVAAAVVLPLTVLAGLSLVNQVVFGGGQSFGGFATVTDASGELITTLRQGGPTPDSNFWGRHLVLGLPLAAALAERAARSKRWLAALVWVLALLTMLCGVYLTQSRGTYIATAAALGFWVLAAGPAVRRRGLLVLPLLVPVLFAPGIGNRLVALYKDVTSPGLNYGIDPSIVGRKSSVEIAWAMFGERPWFGFGPGVYQSVMGRFWGTVETAVPPPPVPAPHNLYAQLAAETGVVGIIGWTILVGGLAALLLMRISARSSEGDRNRVLLAAVCAAIVGWSVASIFLHLAYFRTVAVVLAFAGALVAASGPATIAEQRRWAARSLAAAVATVLALATAGAVLAVTAKPTQTASQRFALMPVGAMPLDGYYAYALEIRSRTGLLPTYAAMMADDSRFQTEADPVRGLITVSVMRDDEASARAALAAAIDRAQTSLHGYGADEWFSLVPVGDVGVAGGSRRELGQLAVAVGAGAVVGTAALIGACALMKRRTSASSRQPEE
jgi:O-antigen ligase